MRHSEETKKKISESRKGGVSWNKGLKDAQPKRIGFKHSEETKKRMSINATGRTSPLKGRVSWRKGISKKVMEFKDCTRCGKQYGKNLKKTQKEWEERKYCSSRCSVIVQGEMNRGITLSKDHCEKLSTSHIGQVAWNKGRRTNVTCLNCSKDFYPKSRKIFGVKYCGLDCFNKHGNIKPRPNRSGEKHHNWKGGTTSENEKIRKSPEYKKWRTSVFERDNFTCQHCNNRGGKLNADHIMPFSLYPELRLVIENGRTLCVDCHNLIGWSFFKENNPCKKKEESI